MTESWIALGMRWDPVPEVVSTTARNIVCVHVLLIAIAGMVALRRRDRTSLFLMTVGVLGEMVALNAMRAIVGDELHYLVFWTTAGSTVAWLGVLSTFFSVAAEHVRRLSGVRPACILLGLLAGSAASSSHRAWRAQNPGIPGSYPLQQADFGPLHSMLVARLALMAAHRSSISTATSTWRPRCSSSWSEMGSTCVCPRPSAGCTPASVLLPASRR